MRFDGFTLMKNDGRELIDLAGFTTEMSSNGCIFVHDCWLSVWLKGGDVGQMKFGMVYLSS